MAVDDVKAYIASVRSQSKNMEKVNSISESIGEPEEEAVDALLDAARYNDVDELKCLSSSGVSLDSKDSLGRTALHMCAANGHLDAVEYLISQGVDVNACNNENNTPLHWACLNGHVEIVKKLVLSGGNLSALNRSDRTPIDEAINLEKKGEIMDVIGSAEALLGLSRVGVSIDQ